MLKDEMFDQALTIPEALKDEALSLSLLDERVRYSVRIKKQDLSAVNKASGLKFPRKIGGSDITAARSILCLGPDEWLIVADVKEAGKLAKVFAKLKKSFVFSAVDISHRNIGFSLSGGKAELALNAGCPLDVSLEAFPVGATTRTVFESAAIILFRTGDFSFHIECWRSFAPYLRDFFARIAAQENPL